MKPLKDYILSRLFFDGLLSWIYFAMVMIVIVNLLTQLENIRKDIARDHMQIVTLLIQEHMK